MHGTMGLILSTIVDIEGSEIQGHHWMHRSLTLFGNTGIYMKYMYIYFKDEKLVFVNFIAKG